MLSISTLLWVGLLGVGLTTAATAQAANQLYRVLDVSWTVKAFGNERTGGTGASEFYSAVGLPQGVQCNPHQPRCPFSSTPTDGSGNFAPLGGSPSCAPWYNFGGKVTAVRPAKGMTPTTGGNRKRPIPPLYRNPAFFTSDGEPRRTSCTATSTGVTLGGKGRVQAGYPIRNYFRFYVWGTGGPNGGFSFPAAGGSLGPGLRTTGVVGELKGLYPYEYSYTYATLRNGPGLFAPGSGPGSFAIQYKKGMNTLASINVKQGAAKFGGTMRMLGALTSKICYYRNGGCSRAQKDWLYDAIGTAAPYTQSGVITKGYQALGTVMYFHTALGQSNTVNVEGSRFPWTTGSVTVKATGRGPHKTVHYAHGYDNRTTTRRNYHNGTYRLGTIQLVTPVLTRWLQPCCKFETVGIAILRFGPEPHALLTLAAGISLLAVGYRMRGR